MIKASDFMICLARYADEMLYCDTVSYEDVSYCTVSCDAVSCEMVPGRFQTPKLANSGTFGAFRAPKLPNTQTSLIELTHFPSFKLPNYPKHPNCQASQYANALIYPAPESSRRSSFQTL